MLIGCFAILSTDMVYILPAPSQDGLISAPHSSHIPYAIFLSPNDVVSMRAPTEFRSYMTLSLVLFARITQSKLQPGPDNVTEQGRVSDFDVTGSTPTDSDAGAQTQVAMYTLFHITQGEDWQLLVYDTGQSCDASKSESSTRHS